ALRRRFCSALKPTRATVKVNRAANNSKKPPISGAFCSGSSEYNRRTWSHPETAGNQPTSCVMRLHARDDEFGRVRHLAPLGRGDRTELASGWVLSGIADLQGSVDELDCFLGLLISTGSSPVDAFDEHHFEPVRQVVRLDAGGAAHPA